MRFSEPIHFMKRRLEGLESDLREKQASLPLESSEHHAEIRRRLIRGLEIEISQFKAAIEILETEPISDLEQKAIETRRQHFGGEPYDR